MVARALGEPLAGRAQRAVGRLRARGPERRRRVRGAGRRRASQELVVDRGRARRSSPACDDGSRVRAVDDHLTTVPLGRRPGPLELRRRPCRRRRRAGAARRRRPRAAGARACGPGERARRRSGARASPVTASSSPAAGSRSPTRRSRRSRLRVNGRDARGLLRTGRRRRPRAGLRPLGDPGRATPRAASRSTPIAERAPRLLIRPPSPARSVELPVTVGVETVELYSGFEHARRRCRAAVTNVAHGRASRRSTDGHDRRGPEARPTTAQPRHGDRSEDAGVRRADHGARGSRCAHPRLAQARRPAPLSSRTSPARRRNGVIDKRPATSTGTQPDEGHRVDLPADSVEFPVADRRRCSVIETAALQAYKARSCHHRRPRGRRGAERDRDAAGRRAAAPTADRRPTAPSTRDSTFAALSDVQFTAAEPELSRGGDRGAASASARTTRTSLCSTATSSTPASPADIALAKRRSRRAAAT